MGNIRTSSITIPLDAAKYTMLRVEAARRHVHVLALDAELRASLFQTCGRERGLVGRPRHNRELPGESAALSFVSLLSDPSGPSQINRHPDESDCPVIEDLVPLKSHLQIERLGKGR